MKPRQAVVKAGRAAISILRLPWATLRMNWDQLRKARNTHTNNILYIRTLYEDVAQKTKQDQPSDETCTFDAAIAALGPDAPSLATLRRRFLRRKRFALATGACFVALSCYAIASGRMLGIATLLSSTPLFFMAALSAQLRLWQLQTRRLSKDEKGGLHDFLRERPRWFLEVLNPEIGKSPGDKS